MTRAKKERPRVLVVYKKSAWQLLVQEGGDPRVESLVQAKDPTVARFIEAHEDHVRTIKQARELLRELGVQASFRYLKNPKRSSTDEFDLLVTLGGDGTFLWASHIVGPATPMLGVNTAPDDSVGYFCAAHPAALREQLVRALSGELERTRLTRMEVRVDGHVISERVLNDVLYSAACPAATTRYILERGDLRETQASSGIWIGPAAGSTAAQRSAGGRVLPIRSQRLQYVVRELYLNDGSRTRMTRGLIESDSVLRVRNKTPESRLYLDGPHREHRVRLGSVVEFRRSQQPLTLLGRPRARTRENAEPHEHG